MRVGLLSTQLHLLSRNVSLELKCNASNKIGKLCILVLWDPGCEHLLTCQHNPCAALAELVFTKIYTCSIPVDPDQMNGHDEIERLKNCLLI